MTIASLGGIERIIYAMSTFIDNVGVQEKGCGALLGLSKNAGISPKPYNGITSHLIASIDSYVSTRSAPLSSQIATFCGDSISYALLYMMAATHVYLPGSSFFLLDRTSTSTLPTYIDQCLVTRRLICLRGETIST